MGMVYATEKMHSRLIPLSGSIQITMALGIIRTLSHSMEMRQLILMGMVLVIIQMPSQTTHLNLLTVTTTVLEIIQTSIRSIRQYRLNPFQP